MRQQFAEQVKEPCIQPPRSSFVDCQNPMHPRFAPVILRRKPLESIRSASSHVIIVAELVKSFDQARGSCSGTREEIRLATTPKVLTTSATGIQAKNVSAVGGLRLIPKDKAQ
jgi:hypothetical protein